jgi:hypothetical protein
LLYDIGVLSHRSILGWLPTVLKFAIVQPHHKCTPVKARA